MSIISKTIICLSFFMCTQLQLANGGELKILSVKEFQKIEQTENLEQVDLNEYVINNQEVIKLNSIKMKNAIHLKKSKSLVAYLK